MCGGVDCVFGVRDVARATSLTATHSLVGDGKVRLLLLAGKCQAAHRKVANEENPSD